MFKSIYLNIATYLLYLFCMQSYSDAVKMHQIIWKEITSFFSIHGVLLQRGYYIKRSGCGKKICKKNHCAERSYTTRNKIRKVWKNEMFLIVVFFFLWVGAWLKLSGSTRWYSFLLALCVERFINSCFIRRSALFHGWWSELLIQSKPLFHVAAPSYVKH